MTTNDIDAIRALANAATAGPWRAHTTYPHIVQQHDDEDSIISTTLAGEVVADAEFIAAARTLVPALCDEIEQLRAKLAAPCGTCHPCTEWAIETWTQAGRKPPHVITWDDAQAELRTLRPLASAAVEWRHHYGNTSEAFGNACTALVAAVDGLPDPEKHEGNCPGYGCPGCRDDLSGVES